MYSKPLYNLFLIFFLAAVPSIYFDRAFMILCAHRAQLCSKIRLFCYISLFLRNYLFRMRLFAAGPGGWVGALWEGWQVCGARFPFFCGAMGTPRPCKRFAVFAAAGVCLVDCTPANGTPFSLYNGVWVCCRYAIRFFVPPAPPLIPGSPCRSLFAPAPEVHLRATKIADLSQAQNPAVFTETDELFLCFQIHLQLPAFNLSCVNCNPSRAILCGTYLIIKGVLPCVNLQLIYLKQL